MKITDPQQLRNYLKARNLKPKDYLGQNFLIDENVLNEIITIADLKPTDLVLEVGPGLGVLTNELVERTGKVIAVEKDEKLFKILSDDFLPSTKKPEIINQDILRFHLDKYISGPYKVVANIPYYLTSKLFQFFLEQKNPPEIMVLMVQKEVGERVVAEIGNLSVLSISIQAYADAEISTQVSKNSFWPIPKVDSVVIKITPKNKYPQIEDKKLFFRVVKVAFAGKRKQIQNSLSHGLNINKESLQDILSKANIQPTARPQDVSIEQWIALYQIVQAR